MLLMHAANFYQLTVHLRARAPQPHAAHNEQSRIRWTCVCHLAAMADEVRYSGVTTPHTKHQLLLAPSTISPVALPAPKV
jgi:hypothetical protein